MTELKWSDVEKCKRVFVFIEFIARDLARDDAREDGGHGNGGKEIERKWRGKLEMSIYILRNVSLFIPVRR